MDALLDELCRRGVIDADAAQWALAHQGARGDSTATALLELDLVDEQALLEALQSGSGLEPITTEDLALASPDVGARLPPGFSRSFGFCPLRFAGGELVVVVERPLPAESVAELHELFGLEVRQLVATSHHLALAWARVYEGAVDEGTRALETRLARRRNADVRRPLESIARAPSLAAAGAAVLDFASRLLEHGCFLVAEADGEHVVVAGPAGTADDRPEGPAGPRRMALPGSDASLWAALRHGGYFAGPLRDNDADRALYAELGWPVPHHAFVSPVPTGAGPPVAFYADNGPRGIASRWLAELTLLVARLGQFEGDWSEAATELARSPRTFVQPQPARAPSPAEAADAPSTEPAAAEPSPTSEEQPSPAQDGAPERPSPAQDGAPAHAPTAEEQAALHRLRQAAAEQGTTVGALVDELLQRRSPPAAEPTTALVGELQGLFARLADDIPAQLARGMETAFREMAPRVASPAPPPEPSAPRPAAAAQADLLVQKKDAGPREVPSYRSRRRKTERVKL